MIAHMSGRLNFAPEPSVSNKLNASRISSISSSLNPGLSYDLAARFDAVLAFLDWNKVILLTVYNNEGICNMEWAYHDVSSKLLVD